MPAFVILAKEKTIDQKELDIYMADVRKTFDGHDLTIRAAYGTLEVLEGAPIEGAVVLEFPDMDSAHNWYYSPAYQAVVQHRLNGANYRSFIIQGI